jgi:hypothetical protein
MQRDDRTGRGCLARRPRSRYAGAAVALMLAAGALPAEAQQPVSGGGSEVVYRREVFQYDRGARTDPFRAPRLTTSTATGIGIGDLRLRGIVFDPDPRQSIAILVERASERRIRARVGERIGSMRIVAIHPRRIDLVVEELGATRRESLFLRADPEPGTQQ